MKYEFEVPGKVIGKGRPRLNTYTGIVYTPTRTKDYETLVEQYFLLKYPKFKALEGRIKVSITAYFSIPKATKKSDINEMLENNKKFKTFYFLTQKKSKNMFKNILMYDIINTQ